MGNRKRLPKLKAPKPQPIEVHKSDDEGESNTPTAPKTPAASGRQLRSRAAKSSIPEVSASPVKVPKEEPMPMEETSSIKMPPSMASSEETPSMEVTLSPTKEEVPMEKAPLMEVTPPLTKEEEQPPHDGIITDPSPVKVEVEITQIEMDVDIPTATADSEEDEVVEEFPVILLKPSDNAEISRLLFHQEHPSRLQDCKARAKRNVKHLELNYEGIDDYNEAFNGIYTGESQSMSGDQLRHAVCFFEKNQFCMLPICDTYDMGRKLVNPTSANKKKSVVEEDSQLAADLGATDEEPATNSAGPVRVKFQKHESEWQKKRREQSAHHRQMLFEKDPWVEMEVQRINPRKVFSDHIKRSAAKPPATVRKDFIPPVL